MLAAFVQDHLRAVRAGRAVRGRCGRGGRGGRAGGAAAGRKGSGARALAHRRAPGHATRRAVRAGRALSKFKPSKRMPDDKRVVCVKCILHALGLCEPCQGEVGVKIPRKYLRHLSVDEAKSLYPTLESLFEDEGKADAARAERAAKVAAAIEAAAKAKASGGTASAAAPGTSASSSKPTAEAERSVAVAGLPFKTTADEIRAHFDACGTRSIRNKFGTGRVKVQRLAFALLRRGRLHGRAESRRL